MARGLLAKQQPTTRLDRDRRADQQRRLRRAQRVLASAHPRQRQGGAFRPSGARRECDPRREPTHVAVRRARSRIEGLNHPLVGHASLSVTRIAGGIADNVIPENCEMVLDRRLLPGETLDAAMDELHALLDAREARPRRGGGDRGDSHESRVDGDCQSTIRLCARRSRSPARMA